MAMTPNHHSSRVFLVLFMIIGGVVIRHFNPNDPATASKLSESLTLSSRSLKSAGSIDHNEIDTANAAALTEAYGRLPLSFEKNEGQSDSGVKYISRGPRSE